ncbi:hypothetical protein ACTJJB_19060 [Chitinophaga sp. 22536]|uniref:hypothetical protein n=1 Tax=unclassified Chitinophaga TaxID=2619133 RepID=UPI003F846069
MKWWIIGCLMTGPVSLQAQVVSEKTPPLHHRLFSDTVKTVGYVPFGTFAKAGPAPGLPLTSINFNNRKSSGAPSSLPAYPVYMMTSHAYYDQHFGFFCKKEWSWQKQTGIPVKLRLGSYQLTQQQEGKH